jgi:hypothetical protein
MFSVADCAIFVGGLLKFTFCIPMAGEPGFRHGILEDYRLLGRHRELAA